MFTWLVLLQKTYGSVIVEYDEECNLETNLSLIHNTVLIYTNLCLCSVLSVGCDLCPCMTAAQQSIKPLHWESCVAYPYESRSLTTFSKQTTLHNVTALACYVFQHNLLKPTWTQTTHNLTNTIRQLYNICFQIIANNHSGLLYFL